MSADGISGTTLLREGRRDRAAARKRMRALAPELLAEACSELRPEVRPEFLMLLDSPEHVVPLLPEAELVHTVRAGGMSDAAWLLELATPEQRLACFDLDCWQEADLAIERVQEWIDALIEAGRPTLVRALGEVDLEVSLLALRAETEVAILGKEDEPPPGWFTPDGTVYFKVTEGESPHRVHEIAHAAFSESPSLYWRMAYGMLFESPAEMAEMALHWRTKRLLDLGFPAREDAMRVYRPLRPEQIDDVAGPVFTRGVAPRFELPRQLGGTLLAEALPELPPERASDLLGYVLAVANWVAVADQMRLSEPDSIPSALEKAVRGIDRGLREIVSARDQTPGQVLDRVSPIDLFRTGATVDRELRGKYR